MTNNKSIILSFIFLFVLTSCKKELLSPLVQTSTPLDTSSLYHIIGQSFGSFIVQEVWDRYTIPPKALPSTSPLNLKDSQKKEATIPKITLLISYPTLNTLGSILPVNHHNNKIANKSTAFKKQFIMNNNECLFIYPNSSDSRVSTFSFF